MGCVLDMAFSPEGCSDLNSQEIYLIVHIPYRLAVVNVLLTGLKLGLREMRFPPIPVKRVIKYMLFFSLIGANIFIYSNG